MERFRGVSSGTGYQPSRLAHPRAAVGLAAVAARNLALVALIPLAIVEAWIFGCGAALTAATIDHGAPILGALVASALVLRRIARGWLVALSAEAAALLAADHVVRFQYALLLAAFATAAATIAVQAWRAVRKREALPLVATMLGALLLVFVAVVRGSALGAYAVHSEGGQLYAEPCPSARARINRWGLRGPERPLEKPAGVRRLAILGDSTTYGWMVREEDSFPRRAEALLGPGWEVINAGVPSYGLDAMRERYLSRVSAHRPDVVLIVDGGNQGDEGSAAYELRLRRLVREVGAPVARPVLALYPYGPKSERFSWVNETKRRVAGELGLAIVDLAVVGADEWQPDRRHPTAAGHRRIAAAVAEALR